MQFDNFSQEKNLKKANYCKFMPVCSQNWRPSVSIHMEMKSSSINCIRLNPLYHFLRLARNLLSPFKSPFIWHWEQTLMFASFQVIKVAISVGMPPRDRISAVKPRWDAQGFSMTVTLPPSCCFPFDKWESLTGEEGWWKFCLLQVAFDLTGWSQPDPWGLSAYFQYKFSRCYMMKFVMVRCILFLLWLNEQSLSFLVQQTNEPYYKLQPLFAPLTGLQASVHHKLKATWDFTEASRIFYFLGANKLALNGNEGLEVLSQHLGLTAPTPIQVRWMTF